MARHHFPRPLAWSLLGFTLIVCGLPVWAVADPPAAAYSFTTLDVPGARSTAARSINDSGQVAGDYGDSAGSHGFVYGNGTFTTFDVPGANYTFARSINDSGQVAGDYGDSAGSHGFVWSNGTFATFDVPGGGSISSINNSGQVTGTYLDYFGPKSPAHGFIGTPVAAPVDIPTLSQWAMLLGGGLLVGIAWLVQVRRTHLLRG